MRCIYIYSSATHQRSHFHNTELNTISKIPGKKEKEKEKARYPIEKWSKKPKAYNLQKKKYKFKFKEYMLNSIGKQNIEE